MTIIILCRHRRGPKKSVPAERRTLSGAANAREKPNTKPSIAAAEPPILPPSL